MTAGRVTWVMLAALSMSMLVGCDDGTATFEVPSGEERAALFTRVQQVMEVEQALFVARGSEPEAVVGTLVHYGLKESDAQAIWQIANEQESDSE